MNAGDSKSRQQEIGMENVGADTYDSLEGYNGRADSRRNVGQTKGSFLTVHPARAIVLGALIVLLICALMCIVTGFIVYNMVKGKDGELTPNSQQNAGEREASSDNELKSNVSKMQLQLEQLNKGGSTYTQWGRKSCTAAGAELVYSGYAGGSEHTHPGSGANYLCLPTDPLWGKYNDALNDDGALLYGAEYENFGPIFSSVKRQDDVPCSVCKSPRQIVLMIPARNQCYSNWTLEYHGYLMADRYSHAASEFVCVDENPEWLAGGSADHNGRLFYQVEARCGSLKCPPYVNGREVTCAVCSI